jgi:hypothetical protein
VIHRQAGQTFMPRDLALQIELICGDPLFKSYRMHYLYLPHTLSLIDQLFIAPAQPLIANAITSSPGEGSSTSAGQRNYTRQSECALYVDRRSCG